MPVLKLDENGLTVNDLNDVFNYLSEQYKDIYGEDIILDADTPDGQIISIISKLNADVQASLLDLYNSFDPDNAVGVQLEKIIKLSGLMRTPPTKSTVSIDITASTTVDLFDGYTVVDTLGQSWVIETPINISAGTTAIIFEALEWGSVAAAPNTITEQGTILTQVTNVNNPNAAIVGRDEETDEQLRIRRNRSLEKPAFSTVGGLLGRLLNLENVTDALVYENATDVYDATRDINPHTIWCIVESGLIADIVEAIAKEKTGGTGLKGSVTGDYVETFERQNGTIRIHTHPMKFDRPSETNIYIKLDVTAKEPGDTIDTELIKNELIKKILNISEDLTITELYSFIYSAGTNFIASNLQASTDDIIYVSDELIAGFDEKFVITKVNITITEV